MVYATFKSLKLSIFFVLWSSMQCEAPDTTQQWYQLLHQLFLYGDWMLFWWRCYWTILSDRRDNRLLWRNSGHIPGEDGVCGFFVWLSYGNQEHCSAVWNHTIGVSIGPNVLVLCKILIPKSFFLQLKVDFVWFIYCRILNSRYMINDLHLLGEFVIDLKVKLCYSKSKPCEHDITVLEDFRLPKPLCNFTQGSFAIPG